jgi:hypothetical protein
MKYFAAALLLATSAFAAPSVSEKRTACQFGNYQCSNPNTGIEVCDITGNWVKVGDCPKGTACEDLPQNGYELPFCTNTAKVAARNGRVPSPGEKCQTPGQYQCFGVYAIQVCNTQNVLEKVGDCPPKSNCQYLNGIPFCVASV